MEIKRDISQGKLWFLQIDYIERVLERFGMKEAKSVVAPMKSNLKLS